MRVCVWVFVGDGCAHYIPATGTLKCRGVSSSHELLSHSLVFSPGPLKCRWLCTYSSLLSFSCAFPRNSREYLKTVKATLRCSLLGFVIRPPRPGASKQGRINVVSLLPEIGEGASLRVRPPSLTRALPPRPRRSYRRFTGSFSPEAHRQTALSDYGAHCLHSRLWLRFDEIQGSASGQQQETRMENNTHKCPLFHRGTGQEWRQCLLSMYLKRLLPKKYI